VKRVLFGLAGLLAGYLVGAAAGGAMVWLYSPNVHDREVEAAMTGAFVSGPLLAVAGLVVGVILAGRSRRRSV